MGSTAIVEAGFLLTKNGVFRDLPQIHLLSFFINFYIFLLERK